MDDEAGTGIDGAPPAEDADAALDALLDELAVCVESLRGALERAEELRAQRAQGLAWSAVVADESRPLVVERISAALGALNTTGGRFRRDQARALHDDGLSINRIAALFGVTRQRASVLVRGDGG